MNCVNFSLHGTLLGLFSILSNAFKLILLRVVSVTDFVVPALQKRREERIPPGLQKRWVSEGMKVTGLPKLSTVYSQPSISNDNHETLQGSQPILRRRWIYGNKFLARNSLDYPMVLELEDNMLPVILEL